MFSGEIKYLNQQNKKQLDFKNDLGQERRKIMTKKIFYWENVKNKKNN